MATLEDVIAQSTSASFKRLNTPKVFLVAEVSDTLPQRYVRTKPLAPNQDEKRGTPRLAVRICRHGTKLLDPDNLAGGTKFLIDAMRYQGLIPQDDPASIELTVTQKKVAKGQTGTSITIEPL